MDKAYPRIIPVKCQIRPNKKISMFRVTGLKILGRVGTHIFFDSLFFWKKYDFINFERHFACQNAQDYIFFSENM